MQRVNAGTAFGIGVLVSIGVGSHVGRAMPVIAFTNDSVIHIVYAVVHRQMKCHHAISPMYIRKMLNIYATGGID